MRRSGLRERETKMGETWLEVLLWASQRPASREALARENWGR